MNVNSVRNIIKRLTAIMMIIAVFGVSIQSSAASYVSYHPSTSKIYSNNIHEHNYNGTTKVSNSYMCTGTDGTVTRVENFGDVILIEKYNSKYQIVMQGTVKFELSKFGGFYSGSAYNYILFGQDNPDQKKDKEVLRLVRYTKDWRRVDSASWYDCNTTTVFDGCNSSFCESNGYIYARFGHTTYKDGDGFKHQSVMALCYNNATGKIEADFNTVSGADWGSIENIGATYMESNAGKISFVDHSLTKPYSVLLSAYNNTIGKDVIKGGAKFLAKFGARDALTTDIPEFTIGGISSSPQQYIVVGTTRPFDGSSANMNVFIETVPKSSMTYGSVKVSYATGHAYGVTDTAMTPYIVKINESLFAVLWEERKGYSDEGKVHYMYIDGYGQRIGDTAVIDGCLSDCQPVVFGKDIVWYTTNGNSVKIYSIPSSASNVTTNNYSTNTTVNKADFSVVYDYNYYMNTYPDMRVLYSNDRDGALRHFLTVGMAEGRVASPYFNVKVYMNNYPDLRAVYGNNYPQYYQHYINVGYAEGRNAITAR